MAFIPILIIVTIATSYVSAMAAKAMTDTFSVISTSISTAMAPLNYAGRMPQGGVLGGGPLQAGANVAATAALAAATGGASAALMAGGGAMIGQVSEGGGQAVGALATGMMGSRANVFASAARGRGAAQVAQVVGSNRRRQRQKRDRKIESNQNKFAKTHQAPDDLDQKSWDAMDAGNYLTTNRNQLNQAETAYARGQYTTARNHLTLAFGSREVAHQVMQHYQAHGQTGMQQVRQMVETTQDTAAQMSQNGERLFERDGNASPEFKKRLWESLRKNKSYDPTNPAQAALSAAISGAVVRPPSHLANNHLLASLGLAQTTLDPTDPKTVVSDQAALLALHDLANELGLGESELEALFEATREGQAVALSGKQTGIDAVVQRMGMHGELAYMDRRAQREAARLALLITKPPTVRKSNTEPLPTRPMKTELFDTKPLPTEPLSTPTAKTSGTARAKGTSGTGPNGTSGTARSGAKSGTAQTSATSGTAPSGTSGAAQIGAPASATKVSANAAPMSSPAPAPTRSGTALDMYLGTGRTKKASTNPTATNPTPTNSAPATAAPATAAPANAASAAGVTSAAVASSAAAVGIGPIAAASASSVISGNQTPPPPPPPPHEWDDEPPPQQAWDVGQEWGHGEPPPPPPPAPPPPQQAWDAGASQTSQAPPPPQQAWDISANETSQAPPPPPPPPPQAWDAGASQTSQQAWDAGASQTSQQASDVGRTQTPQAPQAPQAPPPSSDESELRPPPEFTRDQESKNESGQLPIQKWNQVSVEEKVSQPPWGQAPPEEEE